MLLRRPTALSPAWLTAVLLCAGVLGLVGCESAERQAVIEATAYPPDFTLEFFVQSQPWPGETPAPDERPAQHTVTPDRTLRAALGPGVSPKFHPPATATLSPTDMAGLYRLAEQAAAHEATLVPMSGSSHPEVVYRLSITARDQTTDLRTTPDRNPPAKQLLDRLIELRGGR
ncbi:hypothetical protein [Algisphaera agarilytica]|uniref:Lipoprotein n=1 Tax=Algisphaera agarilytica TaxID=1385975 RepID=A0A7X0H323_9BACT|nr:hypothetical protein [Algisphaera agarilytica]MBB6428363.1 hypothetical protein [Algisphaera agarilytica]